MNIFAQAEVLDAVNSIFTHNSDISITKILVIILGVFIARIVTKQTMYLVIGRILQGQNYTNKKEENKRKNTLVVALNTITTVIYAVIGLIWILYEIGVNFSALITTVGALGVVLGIAGQSVIKDFLRGMSILFYDQMRVGDIVEIVGQFGIVENISLQVTRIRDLDGDVHVIPNSEIKVVTNMTNTFSNVHIDILVDYDNDIDKIESIINDIGIDLSSDDNWSKCIVEPVVFLRISDFIDSSMKIKMLGKVLPGDQWKVSGEFRRRLKKSFDKNGIKMPSARVLYKENTRSK